jgi:hypothetical protein
MSGADRLPKHILGFYSSQQQRGRLCLTVATMERYGQSLAKKPEIALIFTFPPCVIDDGERKLEGEEALIYSGHVVSAPEGRKC